MRDKMRTALDDFGGEPLAGSGFEDEMPESAFGDAVPSATLPIPRHWTPTHIANFQKSIGTSHH
jgi:hypothetical protein